jgi:hypothetical protein
MSRDGKATAACLSIDRQGRRVSARRRPGEHRGVDDFASTVEGTVRESGVSCGFETLNDVAGHL